MAATQLLNRRDDLLQPIQAGDDDLYGAHQLAPLLAQIALEQVLQRGVELKQPAVEQRRRILGDGQDFFE